jgi:hypothetical protein
MYDVRSAFMHSIGSDHIIIPNLTVAILTVFPRYKAGFGGETPSKDLGTSKSFLVCANQLQTLCGTNRININITFEHCVPNHSRTDHNIESIIRSHYQDHGLRSTGLPWIRQWPPAKAIRFIP